ncbi:DNA ligase D [Evansella sp. AB-rgal1]|uniref:DNA ligase D n=1 Tax=Evansella sp. AB-rgal1 TaxID=3242696 RepID=UPI00359E90D4
MANHLIQLKSLPKKKQHHGLFFVTGCNKKSEEFTIGILKNNEELEVGSFTKGISESEAEALKQIIQNQNKGSRKQHLKIPPSICIELRFSEIEKGTIVDPQFQKFRTDVSWEECTWANLLIQNSTVNKGVTITHPEKPLWNNPAVNKEQFISYLHAISPYILPFLKDRILTVLRFPHGVINNGEAFYQKNCPDYAPSFVQTFEEDDINYIVCNDLSTLLWLGNQLALEFHIPFNKIKHRNPYEIVFDLDPPSKDAFPLAIKAALEMEKLFDKFEIKSYPKLSGNKGVQIHIPIKGSSITYDDARIFTEFIALYLVQKFPKYFTVERMKKNRGNKLYIDYVQHWSGKTIICPYSSRGKEGATVAAPLHWSEVGENLKPEDYHIFSVLERIEAQPCPFKDYFKEKNVKVADIITSLKQNKQ